MKDGRKLLVIGICLACCVITGRHVRSLTAQDAQPPADAAANETSEPSRRPLFSGWTKPEFALFITGRQNGYIEPCGCTGLAFQKGGLARRQALYQQLQQSGWDVVPIDVGNQVRRFGVQPSIKFHTTLDAMQRMHYQAIGLGPDDIRLPIGELLVALEGQGNQPTSMVSANVSLLGISISDGIKIIAAGGHKIGITAFLGEQEHRAIQNDEIEFQKPEPAVRVALDKLTQAGCDFLVLLAHASTEETLAVAKKFPEFDIVVTAGGADEPALQPESIEGLSKTQLIQTGKKGMYVGVLGYYGKGTPWKFERVPLDARFSDTPEMLRSLNEYQQQLEALYKQGFSQLGIRPVVHPSGSKFVGSQACQECHAGAYEKWVSTPHHHATDAIAIPGERSSIPRHYDPECLSCHVTGWDPQNFFPYETGYVDFDRSANLHGNGCENCHGPGSAHVAAEREGSPLTPQQIESVRDSVRLPLDKARDRCLECHDQDNDPAFQKAEAFEEYWQQIEHYD